jgi:hypothetical protein
LFDNNRKTYKILKKNIQMIKISNGYYWFLTFVACNSDDAVVVVSNSSDGLPLTAGTNFSKYVALGNLLTRLF